MFKSPKAVNPATVLHCTKHTSGNAIAEPGVRMLMLSWSNVSGKIRPRATILPLLIAPRVPLRRASPMVKGVANAPPL